MTQAERKDNAKDTKDQIRPVQLMIVRNEAGHIEKALTWGEDLFSERIVVDTGSLDRTKEIAKSLGATVHQVKWEDDFSAARNAALKFCPDGWVVFTDADEYMSDADAAKLPGILARAQASYCNAVNATLLQIGGDGNSRPDGKVIRIFKKNGDDIYYRRRIREQIYCRDGMSVLDASDMISIRHTGFQYEVTKRQIANDAARRLIQKELAQNPGDYEMLGYLGDDYYMRGDLEKAEMFYKKSIACMKMPLQGNTQHAIQIFNHLLEILKEKDHAEDEMYEYYLKAQENFPMETAFDYTVAAYMEYIGNFEKAAEMYEHALIKICASDTSSRERSFENMQQLYEKIALCCSKSGDYPTGERAARQVLSAQKDHYMTLVACMVCQEGLCRCSARTPAECAKVLDLYYERNSLHDQILLYRAACDANFEEMRLQIRGRFTPEQQEQLDFLYPLTGLDAQ